MHLSKNGKELEICGVIMKGSTLMATYYLTALIPICCKSHHHSFPNCFFPVNTPDCQRFHSSVIDKNSPNSRRKGLHGEAKSLVLMPIFQFGHLWSQISLSILRFVTCFFMGNLGISWNIDSYLQYHHPLTKVPHHQQHQTWGTTVTWRGGQFMIQTHLRFPTFALWPSSGHCRNSHRAISHL